MRKSRLVTALAPGAQRSIAVRSDSSLASFSASVPQWKSARPSASASRPSSRAPVSARRRASALAEAGDEIGRDLRRRQAEARLGQRKAGARGRDDDVGRRGEAHAAADRRAVDDRDRHIGQGGEAGEEAAAGGIGGFERIRLRPAAGGLASASDKRFQVRAGAEDAVRSLDHERREARRGVVERARRFRRPSRPRARSCAARRRA